MWGGFTLVRLPLFLSLVIIQTSWLRLPPSHLGNIQASLILLSVWRRFGFCTRFAKRWFSIFYFVWILLLSWISNNQTSMFSSCSRCSIKSWLWQKLKYTRPIPYGYRGVWDESLHIIIFWNLNSFRHFKLLLYHSYLSHLTRRSRRSPLRQKFQIQVSLAGFRLSHSFSHSQLAASDGIRQSPRGESEQLPTFGPSGRHERLNCWAKKRRKNTVSHLCMVISLYGWLPWCPSNAWQARRNTLPGRNPKRRT